MTLISRLTVAVLVVLVVFAAAPAQGQGSVESDRAALVALYDATGGDNWTNNDGWKTDAPLSEWHRVIVNDAGRVIAIQLRRNNLTGEIPSELGRLTNLRTLSIIQDNLTGEIPRELGSLTNLEALDLSTNNLTGEIPRELGSLTNLTWLSLSTNNLTGEIPYQLAKFADTINPQRGGVNLPVETAVPALPFLAALLLTAALGVMGLRKVRLR